MPTRLILLCPTIICHLSTQMKTKLATSQPKLKTQINTPELIWYTNKPDSLNKLGKAVKQTLHFFCLTKQTLHLQKQCQTQRLTPSEEAEATRPAALSTSKQPFRTNSRGYPRPVEEALINELKNCQTNLYKQQH